MDRPGFALIAGGIGAAALVALAAATSITTALFWMLALGAIGSALFVVTTRNIIHAAFALVATFGGVAGLYFFLAADFVAAVQLIVYVGGILVLLLFAVMLSTRIDEEGGVQEASRINLTRGLIVGVFMLGAIGWLISRLDLASQTHPLGSESFVFSTAKLGVLILGKYLLPFEIVSVLLLAALIGAVAIARKETR